MATLQVDSLALEDMKKTVRHAQEALVKLKEDTNQAIMKYRDALDAKQIELADATYDLGLANEKFAQCEEQYEIVSTQLAFESEDAERLRETVKSRDLTIQLLEQQIKELKSERNTASNYIINTFDFGDRWKLGDDVPPVLEVIEEMRKRVKMGTIFGEDQEGRILMYVPQRRVHYKASFHDPSMAMNPQGGNFEVSFGTELEAIRIGNEKGWRLMEIERVLMP